MSTQQHYGTFTTIKLRGEKRVVISRAKRRKSHGSVYAPGERVEYSDGTVMIADAKGSLRRVPR